MKNLVTTTGNAAQEMMDGFAIRIKAILSKLGKINVLFDKRMSTIGYAKGKSVHTWFCDETFYLKTGWFSEKKIMTLSTRFDVDTETEKLKLPAVFATIHLTGSDIPIEKLKKIIGELVSKKKQLGDIKLDTSSKEIRGALPAYV